LLRVKLKYLDEWNDRRSDVAKYYLKALSEKSRLTLPEVPEWAEPVWHLFVIRNSKRDELKEFLAESGIGTLVHYPVPPYASEAYREVFRAYFQFQMKWRKQC
jgi:dTDP-4-amino-4,6-dideoxygalactose transaminase